ncbi:MAG: hypothetical protein ACP5DC_08350 [Halothiobacillaceae bacterium]
MSESPSVNYPLGRQLRLHFSPYEDRLVLKVTLAAGAERTILLTRRMVMLVLRQLLKSLPDMLGLEQTPHAYWRDVLEMEHRAAMTDPVETGGSAARDTSSRESAADDAAGDARQGTEEESTPSLYLATGVSAQRRNESLVLALDGLPLPDAMVNPSAHQALVAVVLEPRQLHQVLDLLVGQAEKANWHLPVDLPWMGDPEPLQAGPPEGVRTH